jgi:hypothetical protein
MKRDNETLQEYQNRCYNGWEGDGNRASAYATWRVCLELFSDRDDWTDTFDEKPSEDELADHIQEYVEEIVFIHDPNEERLVSQYAQAFLGDVNWCEIAEHILLDWEE